MWTGGSRSPGAPWRRSAASASAPTPSASPGSASTPSPTADGWWSPASWRGGPRTTPAARAAISCSTGGRSPPPADASGRGSRAPQGEAEGARLPVVGRRDGIERTLELTVRREREIDAKLGYDPAAGAKAARGRNGRLGGGRESRAQGA